MMKRQGTKKPSLIESSSSSSVAGNFSAEPEELLFSDKSRQTSDLKKTSDLIFNEQRENSDNQKQSSPKEKIAE